MSGFLSEGRSGPGVPSGGVSGWRWSCRQKSSSKFFFGNRGGLMGTKDCRDESGLAEVRYEH